MESIDTGAMMNSSLNDGDKTAEPSESDMSDLIERGSKFRTNTLTNKKIRPDELHLFKCMLNNRQLNALSSKLTENDEIFLQMDMSVLNK